MMGIQRLFLKIMLIICYNNSLSFYRYMSKYWEIDWKFTARHKKEIDFLPFLNKSLSCEVREIWHSNVRHNSTRYSTLFQARKYKSRRKGGQNLGLWEGQNHSREGGGGSARKTATLTNFVPFRTVCPFPPPQDNKIFRIWKEY